MRLYKMELYDYGEDGKLIPISPTGNALTQAEQSKAMAQTAKEGYFHRSLVAIDICVNVVLLRGQEDETISSHAARAAVEGKRWGIALSWFLSKIQRNHGALAVAGDLQRAENIASIEKKSGLLLKENEEHYMVDDVILPSIELKSPCEIRIDVDSRFLKLHIGTRDWSWSRGNIDILGCGTFFDNPIPDED